MTLVVGIKYENDI